MADTRDFRNKNTIFTGVEGIKIPAGGTGDRSGSVVVGTLRYNTDLGFMEQYNAVGWAGIDAPPTVVSASGIINEDTDSTITITGSNFKSGSIISVEGAGVSGGSRSLSTTFVNSGELTAATNASSVNYVGGASYDIKVTNPSGLSSVLTPAGTVDRDPVFNQSINATLATINDDNDNYSPIATVSVTDPDSDSVTISETTSTLSSAGMTLNSNGTITGNPNNVTSQTTVPFTAQAVANGQTETRSFNIIVNPYPDGTTAARAFSTLSDVSSIGYSGIQTLYTTLNGGTTAFQIDVDFDQSGGPWFVVSFNFPSSTNGANGCGWNRINNTAAFSSNSSTNHWLANSTRWNRTVNVGFGLGNDFQDKIWNGVRHASTYNATTEGWYRYDQGGDNSSTFSINYYNHGTTGNFTSAQLTALRGVVTQLSSQTPHMGMECDAQGLGSNSNWNGAPITNAGHSVWVQDASGNWLRGAPTETGSDETGTCYTWTHNSYNNFLWSGASSFAYTPSGGTITGLYTSGLILPSGIQFRGSTGGSAGFGTPYVNTGGLRNLRNSRQFFLCK